jgi:hypothetical protein
MVQRQHGDPNIGVPLTGVDLVPDLVVVVVLAGDSGQELVGVGDTREVAGEAPTLHGEAGSVMRCGSMGNLAIIPYAVKKFERRCLLCQEWMEQDPWAQDP